jgi:hypothetical protein
MSEQVVQENIPTQTVEETVPVHTETKHEVHSNGNHIETPAKEKTEEPVCKESDSAPTDDVKDSSAEQPQSEAMKTPNKQKTPAKTKSEKKTTAKKEKTPSAKKSAAKEKSASKSTAKKEKKSVEGEKEEKEEKRGRSRSAKKSQPKVVAQKVEKVPAASKSRERKIDTDEFSKYSELLNKKTSRAPKKAKETPVAVPAENN